MTGDETPVPEPEDPEPVEPTGPAPEVHALFVSCNKCRRENAAARANAQKGNQEVTLKGLGLQPVQRRCPHYRDVWAEGSGPGSEPPPLPGTPEDRRQGPV